MFIYLQIYLQIMFVMFIVNAYSFLSMPKAQTAIFLQVLKCLSGPQSIPLIIQ